ncbi:hypothetical protein BN165_1130016 [Clostridioides difficile E1]|nr:hypothetical protein BN163_1220016 [Clostridioides difficile T5]CCK90854.1 hypothetical protein BN164_1110016 [Clostridioides difficile T20]CCK94543.1 hypothetical protein BN165_1130016 [Clostridioides difficile E1]CCK98485.1 hypothetical protein BN166_1470017 [Clostridioides difficile E10]
MQMHRVYGTVKSYQNLSGGKIEYEYSWKRNQENRWNEYHNRKACIYR